MSKFKIDWKTITVEGSVYQVAAQARTMECGVACLAMILNRFNTGKTYNYGYDIPCYADLKFNEYSGVETMTLYGYLKKHVTPSARQYNYVGNTPDEILGVLSNATNDRPAIVVLQGHYVLCVGKSTVNSNFRVLDPKGGVGLICYMSVHGPGNRVIKLNSTGRAPVQLQGVISTA